MEEGGRGYRYECCFICSEPSLELFLAYLLSLLKADKFNLGLLAGKVSYHGNCIYGMFILLVCTQSVLGVLLKSFAPIFDSQTEKSKSESTGTNVFYKII